MSQPSGESRTDAEAREDEAVEDIVTNGPRGALALASTATAIVFALWYAFYFFVFLPRGVIQ